MSVVHESAVPAPHLPRITESSWSSPYNLHGYPNFNSSLSSMTPKSVDSCIPPRLERSTTLQNMNNTMPTSGWYDSTALTSGCPAEAGYTLYDQHVPPLASSITFSPPTPILPYAEKLPIPLARMNPSLATFSPVSDYSRDSVVPDSRRPSEEPQLDISCAGQVSSTHLSIGSHPINRPHSSPNLLQPLPIGTSWAMSPLSIHTSTIHQDPYYPIFPSLTRNTRLSEPLMELPSNHLVAPQPRRTWTPIAPQPPETPRSSGVKRSRERAEETRDDLKRRKRSDSNSSQQLELSDEDKLLLQLKEEEAMAWKDIAARFQSELGKTYQIPALQMRLKRLRERMRVWTDVEVKALRMANEYWVQHKFDIIAQKMLEFGAHEKWTPRQCLRKWMEIEPPLLKYGDDEISSHHENTPCLASPVEQPHTFLSYMPV